MMDQPTRACSASRGSTGFGYPVDPRILSCIDDLSILRNDIEALNRAMSMCMGRVERNRKELLGIANGGGDAGQFWNSALSEESKQPVPVPPTTHQPLSGIKLLKGDLLAQRVKKFNSSVSFEVRGGIMVDHLIAIVNNATKSVSEYRKRALDYRESVGRSWLDRFVGGNVFAGASILMICANTLYLGFEADRMLHNNYARLVDLPVGGDFIDLDYLFSLFFVLELCLKVMSERVVFFVGPNFSWNVFDLLLVVTSVIEMLGHRMPNLTFVRVLRFCRTMRIIRICRTFRVFMNLRTMLLSIMGSFVALSWAFVLMAVLLYIVAMILVYGVASYYERQNEHTAEVEEVHQVFTNIVATMLHLFEVITGGVDWTDITKELVPVGHVYSLVFLMYVFVMFFGILNTLTGIVVDNAIQQAHSDRREILREEREKQRQQMRELQTIFKAADVDNSGFMSWEEFESHLLSEDVQIILETLSVGTHELFELFELLDTNGTNSIGIDEFVGGVMRLKGNARSVDLCQLMASFSSFVNGQFRSVSEGVTELLHDRRTQSQRMQAHVIGVGPPSQAQQVDL